MRVQILVLIMCAVWVPRAWAQDEPIPRFAADVRGAIARFKADAEIATAAGVDQATLPTRGLGAAGGAHVYPVRGRKITLGIGGEMLVVRGTRTPPSPKGATEKLPAVRTHFSAVSPQLSLNFGGRNGWSYVSSGVGWATFYVDREDRPFTGTRTRTRAINYGGGARWFTNKHLAFSLDLRFYAVGAQPQTAALGAMPRTRNMVFTAGLGFK